MKIILKRKIDGCVVHKCNNGYSYELTMWNIFMLSRTVEENDFISPSRKNEVDAMINGFIESTNRWIHYMDEISRIKMGNYPSLQISNSLVLSPYQTKAYNLCLSADRFFLFMEQGTGKTPVALSVIHSRPECSTLICCPKSVRKEWMIMAKEFFPELDCTIIKDNKGFDPIPGHIYIVNYDRLRLMEKMHFDMIILDECHRLKNPMSASSKALYEFQKSAQYVYGLTGTPKGNDIVDIFGIFKAVDERFFGPTKSMFEDRYCNIIKKRTKDGSREFPLVVSYKNMDEFKKKIASISYRVLIKDCVDIKDPIFTRRWVDNCNEYKVMKNDYVLETENGVAVLKSVLNLTFKLQQICSGFINTDEGFTKLNENKLHAFTDWLADQGDNQVVVYVTYDMSEEMISHYLELLGYKYGVVSGKVSDEVRENNKAMFKNKELQILIIKYKSGTEGLNFQNCNKMVFYDLTPSSIDHEQAKSRIYRRGQERECEYVYMITENSVEEKIYEALKLRKDFSTYLLENKCEL